MDEEKEAYCLPLNGVIENHHNFKTINLNHLLR